jgi:hypothetical protein
MAAAVWAARGVVVVLVLVLVLVQKKTPWMISTPFS